MYHSGALIGNDVNKLVKKENIKKLCRVFKPREIILNNGQKQIFGSHETAQLLKTRFTKFSDCYQLYMQNRKLCRHEVLKLCIRSCSYGNWMPLNFKEKSLPRKLHMLTYEVPRKAVLLGNVGLEAEHCSESIHPFCNKCDRLYRTVQNNKEKLALIAKAQWLASNPSLTNFSRPRPRKCSKCGLPTHYKKTCAVHKWLKS